MCFYIIYHPSTLRKIECFIYGPTRYSITGVNSTPSFYPLSNNPFSKTCCTAWFYATPIKHSMLLYFCVAIAISITVAMYRSRTLRNISGRSSAASRQGDSCSDSQKGIFLQICLNSYCNSMSVCELQTHYLHGCCGSSARSSPFLLELQQQAAIMSTSSSTKSLLSLINTFFAPPRLLTPTIAYNFCDSYALKIDDLMLRGETISCYRYFRSENESLTLGSSQKCLKQAQGLD